MRTTKALITMAAAALFVGCSESVPTKMLIPSEPLLGTFDPGGTSLNTAQAERLEQLAPGARLFDWVRRQAIANCVADSLKQKRRDTGRGLDQTTRQRAGLGNTKV